MSVDLIVVLKEKASEKFAYETQDEDWNVADYSGGNFDDAYALGHDDGEADGQIEMARELLKLLDGVKTDG